MTELPRRRRIPAARACRVSLLVAALVTVLVPPRAGASAQQPATSPPPTAARAQGAVSGTVVGDDGDPIPDALVSFSATLGGAVVRATSDARGNFRVGALAAGQYRVTARRLGYREADPQTLRVAAGQAARLRIVLTRSPTQLSTVTVQALPTTIEATTSEITRGVETAEVRLLPTGRDAASVVDLVPGARKGFIWGGAGDAANNYQLDGVALNHPGVGGDFLAPSIDWIERLEVRGLGAGAEHGSFQGGIINAVTKTGGSRRRGSARATYETPALSATNLRVNEQGAETAGRTEVSGESSGPLLRDRLFYFVGGQATSRSVRLPDLRLASPLREFRPERQDHRERRALAKLTLRPTARDRWDLLAGHSRRTVERAELDGMSDALASRRVESPSSVYALGWTHSGGASTVEARVAGFDARESRASYAGPGVPSIRPQVWGRMPYYQNAPFDEVMEPATLGANVTWRRRWTLPGGENELVLGGDASRGRWRDSRTRTGGVTWRPRLDTGQSFDPANTATWPYIGSEWGGDIRLRARVREEALFLQGYITPAQGFTISEGLRWGRWSGFLTPADPLRQSFLAARHQAVDPRIGVTWDISGRNTFVAKAHWGRYHQGMYSLFFDRAQGAGVYSNSRHYPYGPRIIDPRTTFTVAEREAMTGMLDGQFPPSFVEIILDEAGRVENYRQPYLEQFMLSLERSFGSGLKAEALYTSRSNRDIVGLVDRNLASNYSRVTNVAVRQRYTLLPVLGLDGRPLVLPEIWVSNADLAAELQRRQDCFDCGPVPGYSFADIPRLQSSWNRDIVLTTIPTARRELQQVTLSLRAHHDRWNGLLAVTGTQLEGNTPGLTGFGTSGTRFSAGPFVRPNEAVNSQGKLPSTNELEVKAWASGELLAGFSGGAFATLVSGERFTPQFELGPAFTFRARDGTLLDDRTFTTVRGQAIHLEPRGARRYEMRGNLDLRLERGFPVRGATMSVTLDLFNALGSDAVISRNITLNDEMSGDPTTVFAAPRLRLPPRTFRIGSRVEF